MTEAASPCHPSVHDNYARCMPFLKDSVTTPQPEHSVPGMLCGKCCAVSLLLGRWRACSSPKWVHTPLSPLRPAPPHSAVHTLRLQGQEHGVLICVACRPACNGWKVKEGEERSEERGDDACLSYPL